MEKMDNLYRIGQFSLLTKVTVKTLRFYEEEGLLFPVYVDPFTSYRYYDTAQLPLVYKIMSLKQCGLGLSEIKHILDGENIEHMLEIQKDKLDKEIEKTNTQLSSVNAYLKFIKNEDALKYQIVLKELPTVNVYSCRFIAPSYDSYFELIPEIGEEVLRSNPNMKCNDNPFYSFIIYHDGEYRNKNMDIEYCESVLVKGVDTDRIKFKTIEGFPKAACVMHKGPYSSLSLAYNAVYKWINENGYKVAAAPRESHIDGIWNRDNPEDWLTEVQVPLL